ncbi:MAG TPA: hypothetical protein VJZ27_17065, partial [Aggregatilineales bacterium]|nr:hypothetical protein [Aggregatilineales bacterium]
KPHIAFEDTEDSMSQIRLYQPFTKAICVPDCFMHDLGERMVRYPGYHELAYLHPKRFLPDPAKIAPLASNDRYFVVRFISWDATHDDQQRGTSEAGKEQLIRMLRSHGKVVLSVESHPPVLFDNGHRELNADAMIHLLAFAELYVGEGVTAASEAAVLGTPAVLINSRELGYIKEQEERYRLGYRFADENDAIDKIERMLQQRDLKSVWRCRQEVLLRDKIDVTDWMKEFVKEIVGG